MKLFNIYRNGKFLGSVREKSIDAACKAYAKWANCDHKTLMAQPA